MLDNALRLVDMLVEERLTGSGDINIAAIRLLGFTNGLPFSILAVVLRL